MKLKDLQIIVAINEHVIIENTNKQPLLQGYLEWFMDTDFEISEIVSLYALNDTIHIMIKQEQKERTE